MSDPFFDDEEEEAEITFTAEQARIVGEFSLQWIAAARTIRSMKARRIAWEIACGSRRNITEAAARLGISRQSLHRVIAACKRYRNSYRIG